MLRYLNAGESHGKCLLAIIEGLPSGIKIDEAFINQELRNGIVSVAADAIRTCLLQ